MRRIECCLFALVGWGALYVAASPATACSLAGADVFKPETSKFVEHVTAGVPASLAPPIVKVVSIARGRSGEEDSCDDAGIVSLSIRFPESSRFSVSEVGFQFRVVSGTQPDEIFPMKIPLVGPVSRDAMKIELPWLDGPPRSQRPLDLRVEVFAVAHNGSVGPPTQFVVKAPVGAAK